MNLGKLGTRSKLYCGSLVIWSLWCIWWLISGSCTYISVCSSSFALLHLEESRMTTLLAVMVSGIPLGFFVPGLLSDLIRYLGFGGLDAGYVGYVTEWTIAVLSGFVQWFIITPFVAKRIWRFICKAVRPVKG